MKEFLRLLNQKPIAYYPIYRKITGSTTAGILLSQLMYWFSKKDKIYKTDKEIMEETFLSEKELRNAKSKIKNLSFIDVTREGVPAKTYYKINWEEYEKVLRKAYEGRNLNSQKGETSSDERAKLDKPKGRNWISQKGETITENTTKTTTKTTTNIERESLLEKVFKKAYIQNLLRDLEVDKSFLAELFYYRDEIGKPFKTERMVSSLLNDLLKCKLQTGKSAEELFDILQEQGWKSIKPEWIKRLENNKQDKDEKLLKKAKEVIDEFIKEDFNF